MRKPLNKSVLVMYNIVVKRLRTLGGIKMKKQSYIVTLYNLDTNTFTESVVDAINAEDAQERAELMCTEEQEVESVEIYHA